MIQKFGDLAIDPHTVIAVSSNIIGPVVICRPSVGSMDVINIMISDTSAKALIDHFSQTGTCGETSPSSAQSE